MSDGFSEAEVSKLFERFGRTAAKGSRVFSAGEPASECFIVHSGQIRIAAVHGRTDRTIAILEAGSIFGEECFGSHPVRIAQAEALVETKMLALSRTTFEALLSSAPAVAIRFLRMLSNRIAHLEMRAVCAAEPNATIRVILSLLRVADAPGGVQVSPARLAASAALDVETVEKVVAELVEGGFLAHDAGTVRISSRPRLEELVPLLAESAYWPIPNG